MLKYFLAAFMSLTLCSTYAQNSNSSPLGYWYGQLRLGGTVHELLFLVSPQYNPRNNKPLKGKFIMELLNPADSSNLAFPVSDVLITKKQLSFKIPSLDVTYSGSSDKNFVISTGLFKQFGMSAPLELGRKRFELKEIIRPQTPRPPFAYKTKEVSIPHISESFQLAGTFTYPTDTTKTYPIVIFASGSGAQDRDEEMFSHRLFFVIADILAKNGIGSLRFDDRGFGESGGVFSEASLTGLSEDLESAVAFLRKKPEYSTAQIGLLGHSEGAMHAWMVSKRRSDIDFIISLAGPAKYGSEIIKKQQYDIALHIYKDQRFAMFNSVLFHGIIEILDKSTETERTNELIREFIADMYNNAPKDVQEKTELSQLLLVLPPFLNNAWGREFVVWNPEDYIPFYENPVLFIIGDQDLQVSPKMNYDGYVRLQNEKSKASSKAFMLPGLNHLLQTCTTCGVEEYGEIDETIAPEVLENIVAFIKDLSQS